MNKTKLRRKCRVQGRNRIEVAPRASTRKQRYHHRQTKTCRLVESTRSVSIDNSCSITNAKKNIIGVVKCISGKPDSTAGLCTSNAFDVDVGSLSRRLSQESVIYVGTTFLSCPDMPRKESIVDLTKSETTLNSSWGSYNLENYDISGDNIVDQLQLKDPPLTSSASIFTIFPPKPQSLFSTPSDELCICRQDSRRKLCNKRNLSLTDVSSVSENSCKRMSVSRSRLNSTAKESSDCVWKLKRSYPLTSGLCQNECSCSSEHMEMDLPMDSRSEVDIMHIVDDLQIDFGISDSNVCLNDLPSNPVINSSANDM